MQEYNYTPANSSNGEPASTFGDMNEALNTIQYAHERCPDFPLDLLPGKVVEIVKALHANEGYNIDYLASSMLFSAAVAMGGTYKVKMPVGMYQAATIYLALVGGPGVGKSHHLSFALKPLEDADDEAHCRYKKEMSQFKEKMAEAAMSGKHDRNIKRPVLCKFLLTDYTPEVLAVRHEGNPRGIGICTDELAAWFKNFGRYNKGSEMESWLSNWSGKPINIDRKGSEPIRIPHPFICVAGTIQPAVLKEMAAEGRSDNGFLDRMLFVAPEIEPEVWRDSEASDSVIADWAKIIHSLMRLNYNSEGRPNIVCLNKKADTLLRKWQIENVQRMKEDIAFASIGAKGQMYVGRLALIVHALRCAENGLEMKEIDVVDIQASIALTDYFTTTAMRIRKAITGDPLALLDTRSINVFNALPDEFKTSEGLSIAMKMGMPKRTVQRFFMDTKVFIHCEHGKYKKRQF